MLPQKSPVPSSTTPLPLSHFLALAFPCTEAYKVCKTNGPSFHWWLTRPSSDTYAARDRSSKGYWLVHIVVPPIGLQIPLAPWVLSLAPPLGGAVIHPIADCEHPLLYLLGPCLVSQETGISGSFQQTHASVCNGVIVWRLNIGWIPGYGSL